MQAIVYRERDNLLSRLHPLTGLLYVATLVILALLFSHPLYQLALFLAVGGVLLAAGGWQVWRPYLYFSLTMLVFIVGFNGVLGGWGETILFVGPALPILGRLRLTLEALLYGAGMGLRLLVLTSAFCFYTHMVDPEGVMRLLSPLGSRFVLVITMATRFLPLLVQEFYRIMAVQRCRGVKVAGTSLKEKVGSMVPVLNILLLAALERSLKVAESMQARGYGSGPRLVYVTDLWRPRDYLMLAALALSFLLGVVAVAAGWARYTYYPRLEGLQTGSLVPALIIMLVLALPAVLNWGWLHWTWLKSRI
ncbi:MAG TPA: energy-coupling factor transporter transmembrane protein EcfT [Firmicutes bacterium]|jgi:energy-coupling factor transport system permease protein|nr:energy-coupling factor transporter transmembrane protein EcfT [Bacillota bacterium]